MTDTDAQTPSADPAGEQPRESTPPAWATRDRQIELLTTALSHMPHPGRNEVDVPLPAGSRRPFAEMAYAKGVRVFPHLAEMATVVVAESELGAYAPSRTVSVQDAQLWKILHEHDPDLYEKAKAAQTDEDRAALAASLAPAAAEGIDLVMSLLGKIGGTE